MHEVVATPEVMALALLTAERRPQQMSTSKPSADPQADLVGALAEHVWAQLYRLPQSLVHYEGQWGDGGVDFWMEQGSVDIKASRKHASSWVVKTGPVRADWLVFAYVIFPDTVQFVAKAPRSAIYPLGESHVAGCRLVRLEETAGVTEFAEDDFTAPSSPRQLGFHQLETASKGVR